MDQHVSEGQDHRPLLQVTQRIDQRQCGAATTRKGLQERVRSQRRLGSVGNGKISGGAERIVIVKQGQGPRGRDLAPFLGRSSD